ncbi:MAG: hypothetical protein Q7J44_20870 [Pseudotabrizicola sp.]|uniref:hypothetical protein n=1 Tax=Pseudotabrizicola sp. TaxID=2939647 RepID=UPI002715B295|nr:hypothetical protein [Pseudotabrizicola sp.]MDO9640992.1 hypothetical protein [Pseudotabrizicola sp.]
MTARCAVSTGFADAAGQKTALHARAGRDLPGGLMLFGCTCVHPMPVAVAARNKRLDHLGLGQGELGGG